MKNLQPHVLDPRQCRVEWNDYAKLLAGKPVLSEQKDVLLFFKQRPNLSLLVYTYFLRVTAPDCYAH